jgi:putative flippase GtrA
VHRDRLLPLRWRGLTRELATFGTIGVINLFVNFAVFNLLWLTVLRTGELKAKAVATIVATTCAYFMNRHWTYRDRPKSTLRREYSLFFFFNLIGLIIEVAVVGIAKYGLHQTHIVVLNVCTGIGIMLGTIFRFWAYRTHVFRIEPTVAATAGADAAWTSDAATKTFASARRAGASRDTSAPSASRNGAALTAPPAVGRTATATTTGPRSIRGRRSPASSRSH